MTKDGTRGDTYHHGALREALIAAADEILLEKGVEGFALREAARRAGVSPAAPSHHFGSAAGLLSEVAALGFEGLTASLRGAIDPRSARDRLRAQLIAYVRFAVGNPGRFQIMFRKERLDVTNPRLKDAGEQALAELISTVALHANADPADPNVMARAAGYWSLAHGFAHLALDGKFAVAEVTGSEPVLLHRIAEQFVP